MTQLTKPYWNMFQTDGKLFEQLVGDLLSLEYPGHTFRQTKTTHDGSRDWELKIPLLNNTSADIWFECKFHRKSLAADKVAMTLVMAYTEDAKQVVFFSYSSFNRGFEQKIAQFSERSKIPVFLYGDVGLESLILRHWDKLDTKRYFPDFKKSPEPPAEEDLTFSCQVLQNGMLISCHNPKERPVIRYNDELTLKVTLVNHSASLERRAHLSLAPGTEDAYLICDERLAKGNCIDITLPHSCVSSISFHLKLKRFGSEMKLPKLLLEWEGKPKAVSPGMIEGQWLAETRLIGRAFYDILHDQNILMRKQVFTAAQIMGHSGVGKSRLLHEVTIQGHARGKQIYRVDNDFKKASFLSFVRELFSLLEGLPALPTKQIALLSEGDWKGQKLAVRILYDDAYATQISIDKLSRYLWDCMRDNDIWIVLDNVQWMDERSLQLLERLLDYVGTPSGSGLFLAFNEDYLYSGTAASQLVQIISSLAAQSPDSVRSARLAGFTYEDALTYLRECLTYRTASSSDDLNYEGTLKKVIEHCGTQPFYLQNMLIYLNQCHVLKRTDTTSFLIVSIPEFWNRVQEIPKSVFALLERRIQAAAEHFEAAGQEQDFRELCAVLSFAGSLPKSLCRELFGDFSIKRELLSLGLLLVNDDNSISFYHQYFEKYFQETAPLEQLPQRLLERFCAAVETRRLMGSMQDAYYLARYALGTCDLPLISEAVSRIASWRVPPRLSPAVKEAVFLQLENESENLPDKLVAKCYYAMCLMTGKREGMHKACRYYERCYQDFLTGQKSYIRHRGTIFRLIREYLLSLGNLNRNEDAVVRVKKLFSCKPTDEEYCILQEILCISYYSMGQIEKAVKAIQDGLHRCPDDTPKYLSLLQELGKSYYFHPNAYAYREKICEPWEDAFALYQEKWAPSFDNSSCSTRHKDIAAYLNAGVADLIRGRLDAAEAKMAYLIRYIDHTEMPFYEIKLRFFKAALLLLRDMTDRTPGRSHNVICTFLDQAADICVIHYSMQDYPLCFYLRASAQLCAGRYDEAVDSYKKTCQVLHEHIGSEREESTWSYFYEDMALRLAQLGREFPPELLQTIRSKELRQRVAQLARCSDPETVIWECGRSPILFPEGPWGLPKI